MATQWVTLASGFPPGLDRDTPPTDLKPDQTPSGYGFALTKPGRLGAGSVPTRTARTIAYGTGSYTTYPFYFNRLWTASTTTLSFYAPEYRATLVKQGLGDLSFLDANIVTYLPFGDDDMAVISSAGGYRIPNCSDRSGNLARGHLIQEVNATTATYVTELDGVVYVCNASGLFAWKGEQVEEITYPIRNDLTGFVSQAITCNYAKKWVIGSTFVYDTLNKKLFYYSGSSFLYTSPTFHVEQYRPFTVYKVGLVVEHSDTTGGSVDIAIQHEDEAWTEYETLAIAYSEAEFSRVEWSVPQSLMCKRFAVRLANLDASVWIKEIQLQADGKFHGDSGV